MVPVDALTEYFGRAFPAAAGWLGQRGLVPSGSPTALYRGPDTEPDPTRCVWPLV